VTDYLKSKAPSKIIAIEEHFTTPLYRQHVAGGDYRKFFISSRSEQVGYDIPKELGDLDDSRLRYMDEAGIDVQVLSFSQPGAQGFAAEIAIPMAPVHRADCRGLCSVCGANWNERSCEHQLQLEARQSRRE